MYGEYSLERVKAVATGIMQSWADVNVWPVNEFNQIGTNWELHLWVEDGQRRAVLYELDSFGWAIQKSVTNLTIPELKEGEK